MISPTEVNFHDVARVEFRQRSNPGSHYSWLEFVLYDNHGQSVAEVSVFAPGGDKVELRSAPI
jgi:hypothetical protein